MRWGQRPSLRETHRRDHRDPLDEEAIDDRCNDDDRASDDDGVSRRIVPAKVGRFGEASHKQRRSGDHQRPASQRSIAHRELHS
jgi:hypothetical protein